MKDESGTVGRDEISGNFGAAARPIVTVDVQKYQHYLDGSTMTNEQKAEFLQALWSIMVAFVELGFNIHPLQEVCGKNGEIALHKTTEYFNQVSLPSSENLKGTKETGPVLDLEAK